MTDKLVRLAPLRQSQTGWLYNTVPNFLPSWEATLFFRVHGPTSPGADGLALWLVVRVCGGGVGGKGAHVSLHVRVARAMECGVLTSLWCRCRSREEVRKCESVDLL